jgi:hypothetical protein
VIVLRDFVIVLLLGFLALAYRRGWFYFAGPPQWVWRLTGGRPMIREGFNFTDRVSGESVCDYRDRLGRRWMATSKWARFRVERQ